MRYLISDIDIYASGIHPTPPHRITGPGDGAWGGVGRVGGEYLMIYSHIEYKTLDICLIYVYVYIIYRLPPLLPASKNSAGDDFCIHFASNGLPGLLPASLSQHLQCTRVARRAKVGCLAFLYGREHWFREI